MLSEILITVSQKNIAILCAKPLIFSLKKNFRPNVLKNILSAIHRLMCASTMCDLNSKVTF